MPLPPATATWLAKRGHDAVHAIDLGLQRAPDSDIMDRAKREARTIITADLDYPQLLATARATEPSLILFRRGDWTLAEVCKRLGDILAQLSDDDIVESIIVVDRDHLRRRRLPIGP